MFRCETCMGRGTLIDMTVDRGSREVACEECHGKGYIVPTPTKETIKKAGRFQFGKKK